MKPTPMKNTARINPFNGAFAIKAWPIGFIIKLVIVAMVRTNSKILIR
jgi:hypothetical protein